MSRIGHLVLLLVAISLLLPTTASGQCGRDSTGDICASGSPWYGFTELRIEQRGGSKTTATMTLHEGRDFSIEVEPDRDAKNAKGAILVIAGRAMLMKDVPHEKGYEIDALDGLVLMTQLAVTLLDQALPGGPESVRNAQPVHVTEKARSIRIATSSASGSFEAPWTVSGTVRRTNERIDYDLRFASGPSGGPNAMVLAGYWLKHPLRPLDDKMLLAGWSVYWLTPMTPSAEERTPPDQAAAGSARWPDIASLRKWIDDEPMRRARRRAPADPRNAGVAQTLTYDTFEVSKDGARKALGQSVRQYRPGTDILVEDTEHDAKSKRLRLDHGLALVVDVYREKKLEGFGLVLANGEVSPGFSWEWFDLESGPVFRKLQGGGRVRVTVAEDAGLQELVAIEFLDDITLRSTDQETGASVEIVVRKGSALRLRP